MKRDGRPIVIGSKFTTSKWYDPGNYKSPDDVIPAINGRNRRSAPWHYCASGFELVVKQSSENDLYTGSKELKTGR